MPKFRTIYRSIGLFFLVLISVVITMILIYVFRLSFANRCYRWFAIIIPRLFNKLFAIHINIIGEQPKGPALYAMNHITWIDILVILSINPVKFVSKAEVKTWPVVGFVVEKSGTLFIHRGKHATQALNQEIAECLTQQDSVCLFAEATTTTGVSTRRFYSRLFQSAVFSRKPVQPIAILYHNEDHSADLEVPYIGDSISANFMKIISKKQINVEIYFLPLISSENNNSKQLAKDAEKIIKNTIESKYSKI